MMTSPTQLEKLKRTLDGDLFYDYSYRLMHATDASPYREIPEAIARPRHTEDIKKLVRFASEQNTALIPRAAGTSLAGQVVGSGIVVDISRYMTRILEINPDEHWARVEPGVIRDVLNREAARYGLLFGPETSTTNRCMMSGMVGNNACGAHSLIYGSTRDHTLSIKAILSDGSEAIFGTLSLQEYKEKLSGQSLEATIYRVLDKKLSDPENQHEIRKEFPDPSIKRRNTGYALDLLLDTEPFSDNGEKINLSKLIAGSEGTLAFITEIKLNLVPLPPNRSALLCVHFHTLDEAFRGNLIALKYNPGAVELMDDTILKLSEKNIGLRKSRFFLKGDPGAILIIDFSRDTMEEIRHIAASMEKDMRAQGLGYHFPLVTGDGINKVWELRRSGLGVLSNMPGNARPVSVIEDTAVTPESLPGYMQDFRKILEKHRLFCVYHAHIGTGELHLRPVLNLKDPHDVALFKIIATETAQLVKKYRGSLSGEHGDGRLRGEFIPLMIGHKNYDLLREIKEAWDPAYIFNPGKIIDTPDMRTQLRYDPGAPEPEIKTVFDFTADQGLLRAVEKCNGSGDCRKTEISGGTMCPSYMATRDENTTTRARANILREFLTHGSRKDPFDHKEIYDVLDLCLSCKGCKSECPSNVDITKYKAEFLQHYYDKNGIPMRTRVIANLALINKLGSLLPGIFNFFIRNRIASALIKKVLGFAPKRSIPLLCKTTLHAWASINKETLYNTASRGKVYFFADEFTEYNDTHIGIKAIKLLLRLGYSVEIPRHTLSGRTFLSKGLVRKAKKIANKNVALLHEIVGPNSPLIGIEPSGILTFRDEYPELVDTELVPAARKLSASCLMFDEFILQEFERGNIQRDAFSSASKDIRLHGHCYQKALASTEPTKKMLSLPVNYTVTEIKSGCCGMAGAFGYEKEHYDLSMNVGEIVLFPEIRKTTEDVLIAAPGTSCRHQILDGTGRKALHPVEILFDALL